MIKLLVPDMPSADELLPYLRRIDVAKVYVNHGPLVQELEARLEQITGVPCVTVSSGTAALELALKARCDPIYCDDGGGINRHAIAVPALTFGATGLAAHLALCTTDLADIDEKTWQMAPSQWRSFTGLCAAMPVATFGMPVKVAPWENYHTPVVIDAAGAFPSQVCSKDPNITTCFSLHATKFIGCGEGGFVASSDKSIVERVRSLSTFGEDGTNAKMSEYHAVVALASLDRIREKCANNSAAIFYERHGEGLELRHSSTIMNALLPAPASKVMPQMLAAGIETKQWYRPYLDERIEFMDGRETICGKFPVTDHLRTHLLGLPFHNFLSEADVAHVCDTLRGILKCGI